MSELSGDYAVCRDRLLERLKEPAPGRIQLLTGPRQVGKTTLLFEIAAQFGDAAVYAAGTRPMRRFPVSGSVVGLRLKHGLSAERRSCCSMKSITSATGRNALKANGTNCGVGVCLSILSRRDPKFLAQ